MADDFAGQVWGQVSDPTQIDQTKSQTGVLTKAAYATQTLDPQSIWDGLQAQSEKAHQASVPPTPEEPLFGSLDQKIKLSDITPDLKNKIQSKLYGPQNAKLGLDDEGSPIEGSYLPIVNNIKDSALIELQKDSSFSSMTPQQQQERYLQIVDSMGGPVSKAITSPTNQKQFLNLLKYQTDPQMKGYDLTRTPASNLRVTANDAFQKSMSEIRTAFMGGEGVSYEDMKPGYGGENQNPLDRATGVAGRLAGMAPLVAASLVNPGVGAVVGAAQGAGSGIEEGQAQGWNSGQTAAVATERAVFNGVMGLVPGLKTGGVGTSLLRNFALKAGEVYGINVAQAGVEGTIIQALSAENPDAGTALQAGLNYAWKAGTSPDTATQALIFGGIHAVNQRLGDQARISEVMNKAGVDRMTAIKALQAADATQAKAVQETQKQSLQEAQNYAQAKGISVEEARQVLDYEKQKSLIAPEALNTVKPEVPQTSPDTQSVAATDEVPAETIKKLEVVSPEVAKAVGTFNERLRARVKKPKAQVTETEKPVSGSSEVPPQSYSRDQFVSQMVQHGGLHPDQAEAVAQVSDAVARTWGKITGQDASKWYDQHLTGVQKGGDAKLADPLNSDTTARVDFNPETGKAIITAMNKPDVSSFLHEVGHVTKRMLRTLAPEEHAKLEGWLNEALRGELALGDRVAPRKDGKSRSPEVQREELFARAWERYFREGKAPTPELQGTFAKMRGWLTDIYRTLSDGRFSRKSPLNVPIDDQFRSTMDRLLGKDPGLEVQREPNRVPPEQLTTYRTGGKGVAGNFYGTNMKASLRALNGLNEKQLPLNGPGVKTFNTDGLHTGDASGGPFADMVDQGRLKVPQEVLTFIKNNKFSDLTGSTDVVAALSAKLQGIEIVHLREPDGATVSVDLRDHSVDELWASLKKEVWDSPKAKVLNKDNAWVSSDVSKPLSDAELISAFKERGVKGLAPGKRPEVKTLDPKLPRELSGSSPFYGNLKLKFESDIDKALYITGKPWSAKSKRHTDFVSFLKNQGLSGSQIQAKGIEIQSRIKNLVKGKEIGSEGVLIPKQVFDQNETNLTPLNQTQARDEENLSKIRDVVEAIFKSRGLDVPVTLSEKPTGGQKVSWEVLIHPYGKAMNFPIRENYGGFEIFIDQSGKPSLFIHDVAFPEAQQKKGMMTEMLSKIREATGIDQALVHLAGDEAGWNKILQRAGMRDLSWEKYHSGEDVNTLDQKKSTQDELNVRRLVHDLIPVQGDITSTTLKGLVTRSIKSYDPLKAESLVSELTTSKRPTTTEENGLLGVHLAKLDVKILAASAAAEVKGLNPDQAKAAEATRDKALEDFNATSKVMSTAGSQAAQTLSTMRADYAKAFYESPGRILNRMKAASGKDLTKPQQTRAMGLYNTLAILMEKKADLADSIVNNLDELDQKARRIGYTLKDLLGFTKTVKHEDGTTSQVVVKGRAEKAGYDLTDPKKNFALTNLVSELETLMKNQGDPVIDYQIAKAKNRIDLMISDMRPRGIFTKLLEPSRFVSAIRSSMDLSAPRQASLYLINPLNYDLKNPTASPAFKAFKGMFQSISEQEAFRIDKELRARPGAEASQEAGLHLSGLSNLGGEENFRTIWLHKLTEVQHPLLKYLANPLGKGLEISQRTFTTFLNVLRTSAEERMLQSLGRPPTLEEHQLIAHTINVFTGRGDIKGLEKQIDAANGLLWAPKLVLSRFQAALGEPLIKSAIKLGPNSVVTKLIARQFVGTIVGGFSAVYLANLMTGQPLVTDPRSSDFLKIRFGNTRLDPFGGLLQVLTFGSRYVSGKTVDKSGVITDQNRMKTIVSFARTKAAPLVSSFIDANQGEDAVGQPITINGLFNPASGKATYLPMAWNDIIDAFNEYGVDPKSAASVLTLLGMGTQTYHPAVDDVLQGLPGEKNQLLEKGIIALRQFKANHPEIPVNTIEGGDEALKAKIDVNRRIEEMIRRGQDPTQLIKDEATGTPSEPYNISDHLTGRRMLTKLSDDQLKQLKSEISASDYEALQAQDDRLSAYARWYSMYDRVGQFKGTPEEMSLLKGPSEAQLQSLIKFAEAQRIKGDTRNEALTQLRS